MTENLIKEFLNVEELGEMLGVSKTTIYKWVEAGFIPHYRITHIEMNEYIKEIRDEE